MRRFRFVNITPSLIHHPVLQLKDSSLRNWPCYCFVFSTTWIVNFIYCLSYDYEVVRFFAGNYIITCLLSCRSRIGVWGLLTEWSIKVVCLWFHCTFSDIIQKSCGFTKKTYWMLSYNSLKVFDARPWWNFRITTILSTFRRSYLPFQD